MNTMRDFDRRAAAWLADGPSELNDRVLDAALREVHLTHQRRAMRAPWRFPHMPAFTRATAVAAVALVAVVGVGATYVMSNRPGGPGSGVTPVPTALPSQAPSPGPSTGPGASPNVSRGPAVSYTSKVYGLTLEYPAGWSVVNEAARRWDVAVDGQVGWSSEALDTFTNPEGSVAVSVWQVPAGAGADANSPTWLAGWVEDLCRATGNEPCDGITDRLIPMCRERADCHPAAIVPFTDDVFGYVPVDDQVTIVAVWQPDTDISVAPYGGGVRLVQDFLKALNVWVPGQG